MSELKASDILTKLAHKHLIEEGERVLNASAEWLALWKRDHPDATPIPPEPKRPPRQYKRFLAFECEAYYPSGGLSDVSAEFDTLGEAIAYARTSFGCTIFDCETRQEIDCDE